MAVKFVCHSKAKWKRKTESASERQCSPLRHQIMF